MRWDKIVRNRTELHRAGEGGKGLEQGRTIQCDTGCRETKPAYQTEAQTDPHTPTHA
jgi:hypothetical protein